MDPHAETTPGLALPKPSSEQVVTPMPPELTPSNESAHEVATAPATSSPSLAQQVPSVPASTVVADPAATQGATSAAAAAASVDDSGDALDEEWINKAKAIVERTKSDPYQESQELGRVKADYLRIRYNKHIKVAEEHPK